VTKAIKLIDQDQAQIVVCCPNGASTLAVGPILAEREIPQLGPIPNPSGLSEYPTAAVAAPTAGHDATLLGVYAASGLGYQDAAVIASDFSYGHEVAEGFTAGFTGSGGSITTEIFAPLGAQDFGSFIAQLGTPDVVFAGFAGADAVRFVQQYEEFGMKDSTPLIGHGPLVTELVLQQIGPAATGVGAGFYYSSSLDNPANQEFIDALAAADPELVPSHFTAGAWAVGGVLMDVLDRVEDPGDGAALAEAIRATRIEAPWGPLEFDPASGYAVTPTYYYTVDADGDQLRHTVVDQIS